MPRAADRDAHPAGAPSRRARGAAIEAAARRHLRDAGLREVAANANYRCGELDAVMLDGAVLVFVEVRYRRDDRYGGGAASVDARKRRKLLLAAQSFLLAHPHYADHACRFDVIEAQGDPAAPQLRWLRDAFRADDA
ncbi:YraN family protein [Lysobacter sp. BMK333-48F3]|uniref:YraN family protein n=1 Tax=Lysobacter sp. BMK333-48F3 TaxID=2867962 RepID=UPI001C8CC13F|nr:YraN family protein [Lysobacter sp. BMK333-48F3]MBX9400059.1 YraN family protein [Lysobacter sp. BMK333-48F3]